MSIRKKLQRLGLVLLSASILISASGCRAGKKNSGGFGSLENNLRETIDGAINKAVPKTAPELFAEGAKKALVEALQKSEQINSARFNLLMGTAVRTEGQRSGYTKSDVLISNASNPNETFSIIMEAAYDPQTTDSSMGISIGQNGEITGSGGIYFTDNHMIVKKADVDMPMIRHTIEPEVADSYRSLPALERFMRLLSEPLKPKISQGEWLYSIDSFLETVYAAAVEENFVLENQSSSFAGIDEDCAAITLTLHGEAAVNAVGGLAELISKDPSLKALFVSYYLIYEDTYGITGMDGLLRDLDSLSPEEISAMTLTFKILLGSNSSALYFNAKAGEKSSSLLLRFFELGYASQMDIAFTGFDGGGVKLSEMNAYEGGDNYSGLFVFEDISPGGLRHEYTEMTAKSVITEDSYTSKLDLIYSRAPDMDSESIDLIGSYDYSHVKNGQSITGQSSGFSTVNIGGDTNNFNISVTINQDEAGPPVSIPEFIEELGISTYEPASLYAVLGETLTQEQYNNVPVSMKLVFSIISMLV
ncbi:MAG: hypothetical protein GX025_00115 [Clostridiales bacterium]|nr:hypothetical protein [Clostridiales bacterium]